MHRNREMVEIADRVLVIWDGISRGSKYTAAYAKELGKPLTAVTVKEETVI